MYSPEGRKWKPERIYERCTEGYDRQQGGNWSHFPIMKRWQLIYNLLKPEVILMAGFTVNKQNRVVTDLLILVLC